MLVLRRVLWSFWAACTASIIVFCFRCGKYEKHLRKRSIAPGHARRVPTGWGHPRSQPDGVLLLQRANAETHTHEVPVYLFFAPCFVDLGSSHHITSHQPLLPCCFDNVSPMFLRVFLGRLFFLYFHAVCVCLLHLSLCIVLFCFLARVLHSGLRGAPSLTGVHQPFEHGGARKQRRRLAGRGDGKHSTWPLLGDGLEGVRACVRICD